MKASCETDKAGCHCNCEECFDDVSIEIESEISAAVKFSALLFLMTFVLFLSLPFVFSVLNNAAGG